MCEKSPSLLKASCMANVREALSTLERAPAVAVDWCEVIDNLEAALSRARRAKEAVDAELRSETILIKAL